MDSNTKIGIVVEETMKVNLSDPTGIELKDGNYTLENGSFSVGYDVSTKSKSRGFLKLEIPKLLDVEEILDAYLFLQSSIKFDSNFNGRFRIRYLDYSSLSLSPSQGAWNTLNTGVDWGITSVFAVEGEGHSLYGKSLNTVVKEHLGKELYFSLIHENEGSKIIHFDNTSSYLYIKYKYFVSISGAPKASITSVSSNSCTLKFDNIIGKRICEVCDLNNNVLAKGAYSCTVKGLKGDTIYKFRIRYEGGTEYNTISVTTKPSLINPPSDILFEDIFNGCIISWSPSILNNWPVTYRIMIYDSDNSELLRTIDNLTTTNFEIQGLNVGTIYNFNLVSKSEGIMSSPIVVAKCIATQPKVPTNCSLWRPYKRIHVLQWEYSSSDIDKFVINRTVPEPKAISVAKTSTAVDFGSAPLGGTNYAYMIYAYKGKLYSAPGIVSFKEPPFAPTNFRSVLEGKHRILYWENSALNRSVDNLVICQTSPVEKDFRLNKDEVSLDIGETYEGIDYSFSIQACWEELRSENVSLSFKGDLLGPPLNFRVIMPAPNIRVLRWDYPTSNIDDFVLTQLTPSTNSYIIDKKARGFTIGETISTIYSYSIQARRNGQLSAKANIGFMGGALLNI